jgi:predicted acylesterase/phospholipase RssA
MVPIDCLVMSGGGAKGAYGAGAAKALSAYHSHKRSMDPGYVRKTCYVGTSAGALNAAILAAFNDSDRLVGLWKSISNRNVLGRGFSGPIKRVSSKVVSPLFYLRVLKRLVGYPCQSSIYSKKALRSFVSSQLTDLDFDEFKSRAHLIVCATNISTSSLTAFYVSSAMDKFVENDRKAQLNKRRLSHCIPITSKDMLIDCLIASAAIPLAFPPVKINGDWFIDGGLGNNVPTREAAYFLRHLDSESQQCGLTPADVYCVTLDTPLKVNTTRDWGLNLLWRSYEVFEYVHMKPIIGAWHRINKEVEEHEKKKKLFLEFVGSLDASEELKTKVIHSFTKEFSHLGSNTSRRDMKLYEIAPSGSLGNFLSFDKKSLLKRLESGFTETIQMLSNRELIDDAEKTKLLNYAKGFL